MTHTVLFHNVLHFSNIKLTSNNNNNINIHEKLTSDLTNFIVSLKRERERDLIEMNGFVTLTNTTKIKTN